MYKWLVLVSLSLVTHLSADAQGVAFSGSLRKDSYNQALLNAAVNVARQEGIKVTTVNLNDYALPFFNEDLEKSQGMPANAKCLRQMMLNSQYVFIASPSYNSSITGVLKNVIDWMSRDEQGKPSRAAFAGKKFILMSASPGPTGGKSSVEHLRSIIEAVGGTVISDGIIVPKVYEAIDAQGQVKDPATQQLIQKEIKQAVRS